MVDTPPLKLEVTEHQAEQEIKRQILNAPVINCDETGARVEGKTRWLQVAGTPELTCYSINQKRGTVGMDDMGVLPFYMGTCKHDGLKSYFKYTNCRHSLCNDRHSRELKWVIEDERQALGAEDV